MTDIDELRNFFADLDAEPQFTRRGVSIPGDFRTAWRLSMLCLLLRRGRSNQLVLEHLHVLWWAAKSDASRSLLLRWLRNEGRPDELLVRFDPSLSVTLDLAQGQGLVEVTAAGGIKLTGLGETFADAVAENDEALRAERAFLSALPSRITQTQIRSMLEWT